MWNFKKFFVFVTLFTVFGLLVPSMSLAEECKNASGTILSSQPIEGISLCATVTGGKGDVAPYGSPDGKLDISDAVVTVQMFMQLLDNVDQGYMNQADVAPLCTQENKDNGNCTQSGNDTVNISDAVVIVRLAMKLEVWSDKEITKMLFDLAGATSLQAMDNLIEEVPETQRSRNGLSLLRYRIVEPGSPRQRATASAATNLIAVDAEGNAHLAIQSDLPVKVMYTVVDPDRKYVYMALDPNISQAMIAQKNCALYRVEIENNVSHCVIEGIYLQDFDDDFKKKFGGLKPIQFDADGILYFAGSVFSTDGLTTIERDEWRPIIYRYDASANDHTALTHDALEIKFFMTLNTGGLIYQSFNYLNENDELWLYQESSSISLSSLAPAFLSRDTYRGLFWIGQDIQHKPGIWFARPKKEELGVLKAILYTYNQNGEAVQPEQLGVGDDGRLYGVFLNETGVEVNQLLPHKTATKAGFGLPPEGNLRIPVTQIAHGYLYYLENIDPKDGLGNKDVIQKVDLLTGAQETLLSNGRYKIYAWRLAGKKLHFSGQDMTDTLLIVGRIDTLKVRQAGSVEEYLSIQGVASALSAAGRVRDMEILTPQEPENDPGGNAVGITKLSENHLNSLSIEFSKYMNKASVEEELALTTVEEDVKVLPVWFYRGLHLIPDLDGLLDSSQTTPLENRVEYTLSVASTALDAYNWGLIDEHDNTGIDKTFTLQTNASPDTPGEENTSPTASLFVSSSSGDTSTNFQFDASGSSDSEDSNSILQVRWDWEGDNNWDTNYSNSKTVSHLFSNSGTYTIQVQAKDSGGLTHITSQQVTVNAVNQAPSASFFVSPSSGDTSTNFQFDASGSSDSEDSTGSLQIRWDWEGDSNWDTSYSETKTVSHSFSSAGTYSVQVQVKDSGGLIDTTSQQVTVGAVNQAPSASFSLSPSSGDTSTTFQFDASGSSDSEDSSNILQVRWDWEGDSNWDTSYSTEKTVSHAFPSSGTYTVQVQVQDLGGLTNTANRQITVSQPENQAPVASGGTFSTTEDTIGSGTLSATDADSDTLNYQLVSNGSLGTASITNASTGAFSYTPSSNASGSDSFTFKVSDGKADSNTATVSVTITAVNDAPTASISVPASSGNTDTSFSFDASASSDIEDSTSILQVRWDWGSDGTWDTSYSETKTVSHSFSSAGTYVVQVQVKDPGGLTATASSSVTVSAKSDYTGETYSNSLGMSFNQIPSGTFTMGCEGEDGASGYSCGSDEGPEHQVTISQAFYMQTTEMTQEQWKAVMGGNPSSFSSCGDDCPVEQVSWDDIQDFLVTLNGLGQGTYRLPTEAEWEYTARAGTTTTYSFGDSSSQLGDYAWYGGSSGTHPVATKLPNPWGLYDMHGNVWEWVQDRYGSSAYSSHAATDPIYEGSGSYRVFRGGSWGHYAGNLRSAFRGRRDPADRHYSLGFRLVVAPPGPTYSNSLGMSFNQIPSGTFTMGCEGEDGASGYSCGSDEGPEHQVTISQAFYMQTTEMTQEQWKAVMGGNPSSFSSCGDDCPVEQVSWDDIQDFLVTLNGLGQGTYRLPTEAEWEYTARAGTTTTYSFGDSSSQLGDYAWYGGSSGTHPVATKLPNPWGLYDMHGNVWEWVQDRYGSSAYSSHAATDPIYEGSGSYRVVRGGSWGNGARFLRSANRDRERPGRPGHYLGFRLVVAPPGP